jgi:DNA-binding response OmpR family regulator
MPSTLSEPLTGRVLLATEDPGLRGTRAALLSSFGLQTITSDSTQDALELIRSYAFDLLVLGNTLSVDACKSISAAFRRHVPHGRVVEIVSATREDRKDDPDATVIGLDSPLELHRVVQEQLHVARRSQA